MANTRQRITYFDVAKAIAILAVVWGHFLYPIMLQEVYIFHVPLFFVISGFFISKKKNTLTFIKNKEKQLLIPYILTGAGMLVVLSIKLLIQNASFSEGKNAFMERVLAILYGSGSPYDCGVFSVKAAGPIWYLLALFFGIIIVRLCVNFKWGFIPIIICVATGYITSKLVWMPLSLQAGMVDSGYIYTGYLLKCASTYVKDRIPKDNVKKIKVFEYILEAVIMTGCFVGIYFYLKSYPLDLILLSSNVFPNGVVDVFITFAGAIGVLLFCKLILDNIPGIKHALIYIGKNTLLIMCFHSIDTVIIDWDFILDMFPGQMGKALVIIYVLKIALYIVCVVFWNLLSKLCRKYILDK